MDKNEITEIRNALLSIQERLYLNVNGWPLETDDDVILQQMRSLILKARQLSYRLKGGVA